MRVSISNIAWDPPLDDEVAQILVAEGVDAIDVAPGKYVSIPDALPSELAAVRAAWGAHGIEIVGMQSLLYGSSGLSLFASQESREALRERLLQVCRIGSGLGARQLVFGSPKNRHRSGIGAAEAHEIACEFFRSIGEGAGKHGVTILLEPNPAVYGTDFMTTTSETATVVRDVNHASIRLQLDLGAVAMNNEDAGALVSDHRDVIGHVHVSQPHLKPVDECPSLIEASGPVKSVLTDRIACIEMLTTDDPLIEIQRAVSFTSRAFGDS